MTAVRISDRAKAFDGRKVVPDLSLEVPSGSFYGTAIGLALGGWVWALGRRTNGRTGAAQRAHVARRREDLTLVPWWLDGDHRLVVAFGGVTNVSGSDGAGIEATMQIGPALCAAFRRLLGLVGQYMPGVWL